MVVNIIQRSKKNKSFNKSRIHFQGLRILTSGRLGPFWKFEKGFGLRVHSSRFYYLFLLHRLGVKLVNDRWIRWLYKRYNSVRASSSLGRVARRHARAARWRRRECEGWRKKGEFSFFFAPRRSRVLSRLTWLTTRNLNCLWRVNDLFDNCYKIISDTVLLKIVAREFLSSIISSTILHYSLIYQAL